MAGLGDLIKKQKGLASGTPQVESNVRDELLAGEPQGISLDPASIDSVPSQPTLTQPARTASLGGSLAKLRLGGSRPGVGRGGGSPVERVEQEPAAEPDVPVESESIRADLDSLDAISNTTLGAPIKPETPVMVMPNLVDVQVPDRELPADITTDQSGFIDQLNQVYSIVYDPELFGQFIRMIMQELQDHPEYIKLMSPSDLHVMVRGLRESMGLAQIKKEATKRKPSTEAKAKKAPKSSEFDAILDGMNLNLGDE